MMTSKGRANLSIIIPAYNEAVVIESTLTKLSEYINKNKASLGKVEVVVVASGTDETAALAKKHSSDFDNLKVIDPGHKRGKGLSVRIGFDGAQGDLQIFMDADLATPLHHIEKTVELLSGDSDVVVGVRRLSKIHPGRLRTLFSLGSNLITRLLLFPTIRDTQCGYKGFKKEAASKVFSRQRLNGWGFDVEMLQLAKENKLKITQQKVYDWREEREEGLRGDGLMGAGFKTLADVILVRVESWGRFANRHYKAILAISMLGMFMAAMHIGLKQSIWFDEGYSIILAKRPVSELLHLTSVDAHPPLYYLALKGWATIFGWSEFALRSMSAVFAALSLGAMFMLIKKVFRPSSAVISLPFLIISPFLMRYSFEIRMYSMVMLICILATYVMVKAKESNKLGYWLLYSGLVSLGLYSLYMSVVVWLAHGLYLIASNIRESKSAKTRTPIIPNLIKQKFWIAYGVVALIFAPYVPTVIGQFQHSALPSITSPVTFKELTTILSFGISYQPEWKISVALSLLLFIFLVLTIKLMAHNYSKALKKEKNGLNLFLSILLVPIAFFALISIPPMKPYFMERYLAHFIIFGYALIGVTLDSAWRGGKHLSSIVLTFLTLGLLASGMANLNKTGNFNFQNLSYPNSKEARASIGDCTGSTIVAEDPFAYIDAAYYYPNCDLRFFSQEELGPYGGYVPLRFSTSRVSSTDQVLSSKVYHLHWEKKPDFKISQDPRYVLVKSSHFNKNFIDQYQLAN